MKTEHWLCVVALFALAGLGGASWQQARIGAQASAATIQDLEIAGLQAQVAELTEKLRPPPYCPPLETLWVSSGCGYRMDPMGGSTESLHKGVDLAGKVGTPVRAIMAGTVVEHWLVPGVHWGMIYHGHPVFGGYIIIDHGDGLFSCYGHLSATFVAEGRQIEAGQIIGELGATGIATGPHLHFEVVVDPLRYLEGER